MSSVYRVRKSRMGNALGRLLLFLFFGAVHSSYFKNLRIWTYLLKKYVMENFIFCAVYCTLELFSKTQSNNKDISVKTIRFSFNIIIG